MKITKHILIVLVFFIGLATQAQTFFTEDFNSYPTGPLNTVYDNTTPGHGGWLVSRSPSYLATPIIIAEAGKGNVLTITTTTANPTDGLTFRQEPGFLAALWNNRTPGNNIFKFEYEFYGEGTFNFSGSILNNSASHPTILNTAFQSFYNLHRILGTYLENSSTNTLVLKNYNATTWPYNMWIKAEMFVDFNTNNVYFYIPTLNIQATAPFSHNAIPFHLVFSAVSLGATSVVKIDNIKVSGLKTLPTYILSTNEQLATKFNMYPNPVTNVVNIANSENTAVQQVTIYDITGKQLSTLNFNNENQIQLNVENLASGTYLLHLQTNEGTAIKKLVKK